jgi:hypothetical protein
MELNKIGNRTFHAAHASPALPASGQMGANLDVPAGSELAIGGENKILIGKMIVWMRHG